MPRSRRVLWIAAGATLLSGVIALVLATRGGASDPAHHDDERARDAARSTEATATTRTTRDHASGLNAKPPAAAGSAAGAIPLEAVPELAEAFRTAHFQDAVELCGAAATFAAHQGDCTIAACRAHLEARARGWFARVSDDDRDRVAKACEDAKITLGPKIRPHPRPHGRRGVDLD